MLKEYLTKFAEIYEVGVMDEDIDIVIDILTTYIMTNAMLFKTVYKDFQELDFYGKDTYAKIMRITQNKVITNELYKEAITRFEKRERVIKNEMLKGTLLRHD